MFYALATNKVRVPGLRFTHKLCDIETLNQKAREGEGVYDVTAISFTPIPTSRIITLCFRAEAASAMAMAHDCGHPGIFAERNQSAKRLPIREL
jgi:hypothetical protein